FKPGVPVHRSARELCPRAKTNTPPNTTEPAWAKKTPAARAVGVVNKPRFSSLELNDRLKAEERRSCIAGGGECGFSGQLVPSSAAVDLNLIGERQRATGVKHIVASAKIREELISRRIAERHTVVASARVDAQLALRGGSCCSREIQV